MGSDGHAPCTTVHRRVPAGTWRRAVRHLLDALGLEPDDAADTAEVLTAADLMGIDSHGAALLPLYERLVAEGAVAARRRIEVAHEAGAVAMLDAGGGLGHRPTLMAVEMAAERAERLGIAAVGVRRSGHYGAAGVYARRLAERGLVGICCANVWQAAIVPTGGLAPRLGTNPWAFAAPSARGEPFLLDMATSAAAIGKIKLAQRAGRPLPEGWALTREGAPERDPEAALADTLLEPLGGHKGYGLAVMVEILAGVLCGATLAPVRDGPDGPSDIGHLVVALDPGLLRGSRAAFEADMDRLADALRATPARDPARPVLVAGDPERAQEARRRAAGIPLPPALEAQLRGVAQRLGAPFALGAGDATETTNGPIKGDHREERP